MRPPKDLEAGCATTKFDRLGARVGRAPKTEIRIPVPGLLIYGRSDSLPITARYTPSLVFLSTIDAYPNQIADGSEHVTTA